MSHTVLLSLTTALFVYILLMIYFKDNNNNFLIAVSTGLFVFLLNDLFIGDDCIFSNLQNKKQTQKNTKNKLETFKNFNKTPIKPSKLDNENIQVTKPISIKYPTIIGTCDITKKIFDILYKNKLEYMRENMKKNHSKNVYNNIENEINKII